jgi:multidrug efflux pump subunit AcrA (membrane-fusion protein)
MMGTSTRSIPASDRPEDQPEDRTTGDAATPAERPRVQPRPRFRPPKKRPIGRIALGLLVIAIIAAVVFVRMRPKPVTTTAVVRGIAVEAVYATGTVEAYDRVTIKARVAGAVAELKVREGDRVKKGDLLAVIDSPTLKYELAKGKIEQWAASQQASKASPLVASIEAQAKATEAELKGARDDRDRLKKLVSTGSATQADLDKAENRVAMLEAQLAAQQAQRRSLLIDLGAKASGSNAAVEELAARLAEAELRSPLDGVVLSRSVEPGEYVPLNGPLVRIGNVDALVLECAVDEADIGRIAIGRKAAVALYAFPKQAFHGEVFEIFPDADRTKKTFLVKVRLSDAPAGLRSGMSGEVNLVVEEHPGALLVAADAIDAAGMGWVVAGDRAEQRKITIGIRDMLRAEVLSGLVEGDRVVVTGADALKPGARVKATFVAPDVNAVLPKSSGPSGGSL